MRTFCQDDADFNLTSRERKIQYSFISRTCGNPVEKRLLTSNFSQYPQVISIKETPPLAQWQLKVRKIIDLLEQ